ncbi:hypothetical protein CROQUDRAFT_695600 [Cronartium quercuum f. sp. fusiforme G11]|uniref:Uncharacterized protein n=1 Tax=Cronartium quercuum f. sp. fusiforme G11 TaxID=708437 RepID=A0A9P6N999_9BASI|nr:hypothetical protein CROQUDRAFT_695600 [Cronartium quercuum f. sp. fusiforme G11]
MMQKISLWLCWFLSKPMVESSIVNWSATLNQGLDFKIHDIQQSPAWHDITWPPSSSIDPLDSKSPPLNLVFSLFCDWFNPRGNKNKGKLQSMGIIAMNCLNLPPAEWNLIRNTCLAGIMPGPNMPDVMTISHVLKGLVDELEILEKGIEIMTRQFPKGRII